MGRQSKGNAFLAGGLSIAVVELVGPPLFRWFGWPGAARALESLVALGSIEGVTINWPGVFFWAAIMLVAFLVAWNWSWAIGVIYARRRKRQRNWKTPVSYAVHYIANHSMTVSATTNRAAFDSARAAFEEAAKRGQIRVAGIRRNEHNISEIPKRIWGAAELTVEQWNAARGDSKSSLSLSWEDSPIYTNLLVDHDEMEKAWIERPSSTGWMRL